MINQPLVSVVIPTYKRPAETLRAVESVIDQDYSNIEIIVVDDNDDNSHYYDTKHKLTSYIETGVLSYVKYRGNKGGSFARNRGVEVSSGILIAFLDSDDEFVPYKLSCQVNRFIENEKKYDLVAVTCNRTRFNNGIFCDASNNSGLVDDPLPILTRQRDLGGSSVLLMRRSVYEDIGGFDERLKRQQDVDLYLRLLQRGIILAMPESLVKVNVDDRSSIPTTSVYIENQDYFIKKHLQNFSSCERSKEKLVIKYSKIDIAKVALRNKNIFIALDYLFRAGINFKDVPFLYGAIGNYIRRYLLKR